MVRPGIMLLPHVPKARVVPDIRPASLAPRIHCLCANGAVAALQNALRRVVQESRADRDFASQAAALKVWFGRATTMAQAGIRFNGLPEDVGSCNFVSPFPGCK
jgi:hypothetical protein